jgi:hypothetical protein
LSRKQKEINMKNSEQHKELLKSARRVIRVFEKGIKVNGHACMTSNLIDAINGDLRSAIKPKKS